MGQRQGSPRISQLDGLRGLAILQVLGLHFLNDSSHGAFGSFLYRFGSAFRLGWAGVDLFFVLSGFLIGGILLDARGANNYFRVFYIRRLHRIIPVFYLWITLFVLIVALAGDSVSHLIPTVSAGFQYVPLYYLFLQNYIQLPFPSFIWVWLAAAWSLGVEEQFYLLAPPLIRFLSSKSLKLVLVSVIFVAPLLRIFVYFFVPSGPTAMYAWMPCRADSLAFGVLAAILWRDGSIRRWYSSHPLLFQTSLAILGLAIPVFIKWMFVPYTLPMGVFGYSWLALFFTGLLLLCLLEPNGLWSSFLRLGFLREMGKLSYCIYLIHLAILHLAHRIILHAPPRIYDLPGATVSFLAFALTYAAAKFSWTVFEHPLVRRGHAFKYHQARVGEA
jgi:peptidoglycan/LPS O-acetylase OafA/YrhL